MQILTDSEFSSPRRGRFSSTREEKPEGNGAAEKLLDINAASLDLVGTSAKTPAASTDIEVIHDGRGKVQKNQQPLTFPDQIEQPQHSKNPRSFAKSMVEVSKPAVGHSALAREEPFPGQRDLQGRFEDRSAEGEAFVTRSAFSQ